MICSDDVLLGCHRVNGLVAASVSEKRAVTIFRAEVMISTAHHVL
jgi:hypothetical protein